MKRNILDQNRSQPETLMPKDPYTIKASERGAVRVFTTELEPEGDAAITPQNVYKLLGDGVTLVSSKVEVFPSKVLAGLGLTNYLAEGYGIPPEDMAGKAAALDALKGLVILVPSSAFGGNEQVLEPSPALRFIGMFHEPKNAPPKQMAESEASKGLTSPQSRADTRSQNQVRYSWLIAIGALIIAAALVLFAVF
ncbi:MAG: hypothetical protein HKN27_07695 [Silicimonas sp.]|nr:hypothetical protein [Silicimonas sp.]